MRLVRLVRLVRLTRLIRFIVYRIERGRPGHTRGDFRANPQGAHAKRADHGAACFTARNNQAPNTLRDQGLGDSRQHPLDGLLDASRRCSAMNSPRLAARSQIPGSPGSADLLSGCGRINQDRSIAEFRPLLRPLLQSQLRACPLNHLQNKCIRVAVSLLGIDAP